MLSKEDNELLELVKSISSNDLLTTRDVKGIPHLKSVFYLYQKLFGETCSTCPNKIAGYITKLKKYNFKNNIVMTKSRYVLQDRAVLVVPGTSEAYSNHNLTDNLAIKFLAQNINRKSLFSKLPKEVDQEIEDFINEGILPEETAEEVVAENIPAKVEIAEETNQEVADNIEVVEETATNVPEETAEEVVAENIPAKVEIASKNKNKHPRKR
jgi:hypothetical protein